MPSTYLGKQKEDYAMINTILRESMFADAELLIWEPEYRIYRAASQTEEMRMRYQ